MKNLYKKAKYFFDKYERYLMPLTMIFGFTVDSFTLRRIDLGMENLIIIGYLTLATLSILYLNNYRKKVHTNGFLAWLNLISPFILQYAFGALFSAFIVFYARSSAFVVSWPFLLILLSLLFGNEFFRKSYEKLSFHIAILYLALFAYSVFALPVLVSNIGALVFLGSGLMSLILISLVIFALYKINSVAIVEKKSRLIGGVAVIYLLFNILYFSNIIPPIPLAMKEGGVYHKIARVGGEYQLTFEKPRWYAFWRETAYTYNYVKGERIYIFSSIFAPTKFNEKIYHRWSQYDEDESEWIEKSRISFFISGGRDNGYRGYTYRSNITSGKWRVDVITDTEQVLGRIKFKAKEATEEVELNVE